MAKSTSQWVPTLDEFAIMAAHPLAPNAVEWLPAAPRWAGEANNAARKAAVAAQHIVANAAKAGVETPIVVDEADAAAMHCHRRLDSMEVIDVINSTILQSMLRIGEALKARGAAAMAVGGTIESAETAVLLPLRLD